MHYTLVHCMLDDITDLKLKHQKKVHSYSYSGFCCNYFVPHLMNCANSYEDTQDTN